VFENSTRGNFQVGKSEPLFSSVADGGFLIFQQGGDKMKKLILFCLLSIFFLQEPAFSAFNFVDNGDGTVIDMRTGLIWLKNANPCGQKDWYDAMAYCSSLAVGTAGLTDASEAGQWRLPSKEELQGIGTDPPATWSVGIPSVTWTMPGAPFINVQSWAYWSSTTNPDNTAWYVEISVPYTTRQGQQWPCHHKFIFLASALIQYSYSQRIE
jgi:hypothetical protein